MKIRVKEDWREIELGRISDIGPRGCPDLLSSRRVEMHPFIPNQRGHFTSAKIPLSILQHPILPRAKRPKGKKDTQLAKESKIHKSD